MSRWPTVKGAGGGESGRHPRRLNCFYDHVHFTFPGNYVLARAIAEEVEKH